MKVVKVDLTSATLSLSSADLYTLANGNLYLTEDPSASVITGIFGWLADGQTIANTKTNSIGGTSVPPIAIQPSYYPKAIQGAECAAHVNTLDWANENLYEGYQWCKTVRGYFVAGVLNSTQTQANDPFTSGDIIGSQVACWKEEYSVSFNPFV